MSFPLTKISINAYLVQYSKEERIMVRPRRRPGRAVRRRLSADQRRSQIVTKAAELFARKGLAGTRIRDIALACAASEAILYRYFPGKEALFEAVLEEKIATYDVEGYLARLPGDVSLTDTFQAVALWILRIGLDDPTIHRLLLAASISGSRRTQGIYVTWRLPFVQFLEGLVRDGIERGELRPVEPTLTARAFVGLVMDCALSCRIWCDLGYTQAEPSDLVRNNVPTFVRGLYIAPQE